jgi:hypothetical protein
MNKNKKSRDNRTLRYVTDEQMVSVHNGQSVSIQSFINFCGGTVDLSIPMIISRESDEYHGLSTDDGGTESYGDIIGCSVTFSLSLAIVSPMIENCPLRPGCARIDEYFLQKGITLKHIQYFLKSRAYTMFQGDLYYDVGYIVVRMRQRSATGSIVCHTFTPMTRPCGNCWDMRRGQSTRVCEFLQDQIKKYEDRLEMLHRVLIYKARKNRVSKLLRLMNHKMFDMFVACLDNGLASELFESLLEEGICAT